MTNQTSQVNIHPIAALNVAERQIIFDKNEKLLLQQQVFELTEIVDAQKSQIAELESMLAKKADK